ncbi:hypothetical protein FIV50_01430 [Microbacterium foliorum]|uniref:Acyltransferase 3 domain-containing protein n=1 Tax=Microbacterium foliorum TaxID=104336 RepID=A0A4Y5YM01_9MICO|nr:hypothetical protein FIV50_01430 [Microbacterium foliorum]
MRRCREDGLLPHRRGAGAERGQHDAGVDRGIPGAADVRGSRRVVRRAGVAPRARRRGAGAVSARVGWPDVVKGVCIILVVLWHVVTKHAIEVDGAGAITGAWATLNAQLLPLRMPLFFLISGMFDGSVVNAPAGTPWRRRAGRLAAAYVIWVVIQTFVLALTPDFDTARAENG